VGVLFSAARCSSARANCAEADCRFTDAVAVAAASALVFAGATIAKISAKPIAAKTGAPKTGERPAKLLCEFLLSPNILTSSPQTGLTHYRNPAPTLAKNSNLQGSNSAFSHN
jgi:hypothetical protein